MLIVRELVYFNCNGCDDDADNCGGHFQLLQYVVAGCILKRDHTKVKALWDGWLSVWMDGLGRG